MFVGLGVRVRVTSRQDPCPFPKRVQGTHSYKMPPCLWHLAVAWSDNLIGCKLNFFDFWGSYKVVDSESFNCYFFGFWASE